MKLVAAPLFIRITRLTRNSELSQVPTLVVNRLRIPRTIHNRVTKRASVRRTDFAPVVDLLIRVRVTLGAGSERACGRAKPRAFVLRMTIDASDPRSVVLLDYRRDKRFRVMACGTTLLHDPRL